MNKKKARKIVIAMWVLSYVFVLIGVVLSLSGINMYIILMFGAMGVATAYISETVIDHYDL